MSDDRDRAKEKLGEGLTISSQDLDIGVLEESALAMAQSTIQNVIDRSCISKSELARRMKINRSGITRMLCGSHNLTVKTMARALAVCGHEVRFETVPIVWNWQTTPQEALPTNVGSTTCTSCNLSLGIRCRCDSALPRRVIYLGKPCRLLPPL